MLKTFLTPFENPLKARMLCFKPVLKENYYCFNGICVKPSKSFYFHSLCSCFCIEQTLNSSDCVNLQLKLGRDEVNDGVLDSVDCSDLLHFEVHLISKIKIYIELGKSFFAGNWHLVSILLQLQKS